MSDLPSTTDDEFAIACLRTHQRCRLFPLTLSVCMARSSYGRCAGSWLLPRGADKAEFAKKLGAATYIDSQAQDPSAELQKLGGAKVVLAAVTNADAMAAVMGCLGAKGVFMIVGAVPKLEVPSLQMLLGSQEVRGWYSGTTADSEDALNFSLLQEVRSMNEVYKLEQFKEGYERMMSGKALPGGYDDGVSQSVVGHADNPLSDAGLIRGWRLRGHPIVSTVLERGFRIVEGA